MGNRILFKKQTKFMLKTQKEEYSESKIQLKYRNTFEMMNNVNDFFYYRQGTVCPIVLNYNFNKKNRK